MHMLIAGGSLASIALLITTSLSGSTILGSLLVWALLMVAVGSVLVFARRYPKRATSSLSRGPYAVQPSVFLLFAISGICLLTVDAAEVTIWILLAVNSVALFLIVALAADSSLRHAIAGTVHLVAHERPQRFSSPGSAARVAMPPLDLSAATLGARQLEDFSWVQLAAFDSCVECGRCEEACPAYAAGMPLNPKALIQDLARTQRRSLAPYSGHDHPGAVRVAAADSEQLVGALQVIRAETIWACTTCRACVQECPMMIEHVDAIGSLRRNLTLEQGATHGAGATVLDALALTGNPTAMPPAARIEWATDLDLPRLASKRSASVLLWLGPAAFEQRNQRTLRMLAKLMRRAGEDFAVLGEEEWDVGDTARRLGDEAQFQDCVRRVMSTLKQYRFERIVTADPHVMNALRNDYAVLGYHLTVEHHTQYLMRLIDEGRLQLEPAVAAKNLRVTLHDPCYLGRYNQEYAAPRRLLAAAGVQVIEMQRSRRQSRCCGAGGGVMYTDVQGEQRISTQRMQDVQGVGADVVAVACPNCAVMLESARSANIRVADVVEFL